MRTTALEFDLLDTVGDAFVVDERDPPSKWVAENVYMPPKAAVSQGRYSVSQYPYVAGVLDAFVDPQVEEIVMQWATQVGKTALLTALVGYISANDPGPTAIVGPDRPAVLELSTTRIYPTFEASPELARQLLPEHRRQALLMDLPEQFVHFAWSGSVSSLGAKTIRFLMCTEIDKWSKQKSSEGDSLSLAEERVKAYPGNTKRLFESTPSIAGDSRIEEKYEASDRRVFELPCPHCEVRSELEFEQLRWPHGDDGHSMPPDVAREQTHYECKHCKGRIEDIHKPRMLLGGRWIKRGASRRIAGFHLSSLYSPAVSFGQVGEAWLRAARSGEPRKIQTFVNGWLARTYAPPARETRRDQILAHRVLGSALEFAEWTMPMMPAVIVLTADVQQESIYWTVRGWEATGTSAMAAYGQCRTWDELYAVSQTQVSLPDGSVASAGFVFVDSGYRTEEVYRICEHFNWNPTKGHDSDRAKDVSESRQPGGQVLFVFSAPKFKEELFYRIVDVPVGDPGGWLLHKGTDFDYARHLTSEKRVPKKDQYGRTKQVWVLTHHDNHWLDCEVLQCLALTVLERGGELAAPKNPEVPTADDSSAKPYSDWVGGDPMDDFDLSKW